MLLGQHLFSYLSQLADHALPEHLGTGLGQREDPSVQQGHLFTPDIPDPVEIHHIAAVDSQEVVSLETDFQAPDGIPVDERAPLGGNQDPGSL